MRCSAARGIFSTTHGVKGADAMVDRAPAGSEILGHVAREQESQDLPLTVREHLVAAGDAAHDDRGKR
jgi:hypothetical protein